MRLWWIASLLAGCGATASGSEPVTLPPSAVEPATPTSTEPSWRYVPRLSALGVPVEAMEGEATIVAQARYRAREVDGHTEWARQLAPDWIAALTPWDGRWVFATGAGELFVTSDPLGDLTRIGAMDAPWGRTSWPALLDVRGHLFRLGAEGLSRVPTPGPVVDVAFFDPSFGARIDATGLLFVTRDGGESWSLVELTGESPLELSPGAAGIVVTTSGGARTLARDGSVGDRSARRDTRSTRFLRLPDLGSGPTEDGHIGAIEGRVAVVLPEHVELGAASETRRWGRFITARTASGWVRSDGGAAEPFGEGFARRAIAFDETGERFASHGPCPSQADDASPGRDDAICLVDLAEHTRRTLAYPDVAVVRRWVGDRLFVEAGEPPRLVVLDVATGGARTSDPTISDVSVAEDGTCAGVDPNGGYWLGPPDALGRVMLPGDEIPTSIVPADARHVVALGASDRWVSEDGGHTWVEAPAIEGPIGRHVHCTLHGCSLGDGVWGPSALLALVEHPSAEGAASPPRLAPTTGTSALLGLLTGATPGGATGVLDDDFDLIVECDAPGPWAGHPLSAPLPPPDPRLAVGQGWVHLAASGSFASGRLRGELAPIGGRAARFVSGQVPGPPGSPTPSDEPRDQPRLAVVASTATSAFIVREWVVATGRSVLDLVRVSTSEAPEVVAVLAPNGSVGGALAQSDGSVVVWLMEPQSVRDQLVVVDPRGERRVQSVPTGSLAHRRYLARLPDGAIGFYRVFDGEAWWVGLDGSARGPWTPLDPFAVPRPCGAADPDAIEVVPRANRARTWMPQASSLGRARLTLAVRTDGSSCLASAWEEDDDWRGARSALAMEPAGETMRAVVSGPADAHPPFSCVVRGESERLRPAAHVLVAPLAAGAGALVADERGRIQLGTLADPGWSFAATDARWREESRFALIDGASVTTAIVFGPPAELATRTGAEALGVGEIGRAADGLAITSTFLDDERLSLVVARRGTTTGATLRVEGFAVGAQLAVHGDRAAGLLFVCAAGSDGQPGLPCTARGIEIVGTAISTHAVVSLDDAIVLAHAEGGLAALTNEERDERVLMQLRSIAGTQAEPIGPPIARTAYASMRGPIGLAARLGPPTLAYLDGTDTIDNYVRVVELRGHQWWDVAPPLHVRATAGAAFVGDDLVVVDAADERIVSHRLHAGAWTEIALAR